MCIGGFDGYSDSSVMKRIKIPRMHSILYSHSRNAFGSDRRRRKRLHPVLICTILTEFGLDPGLDLIVGAAALREVDEVEVFNSYGAGFPTPDSCGNALSYKFTWSVKGALLSYKRPAKIIKDGQIVEIPGMEMFAPENMHIIEDEQPVFGGNLKTSAPRLELILFFTKHNGLAKNDLSIFDNGVVEGMALFFIGEKFFM